MTLFDVSTSTALQAEPKKKTTRKRATPKKPASPHAQTYKEISKIVKFYLENVRMHDKSEMVGIFRQVKLLTDKGVPVADLSRAVQNYARNEFVRSCPPQGRHHIRKFFMLEKVKQWANLVDVRDGSLQALERLTHAKMAEQMPAAAPVLPTFKAEEEEEEELCSVEL